MKEGKLFGTRLNLKSLTRSQSKPNANSPRGGWGVLVETTLRDAARAFAAATRPPLPGPLCGVDRHSLEPKALAQ